MYEILDLLVWLETLEGIDCPEVLNFWGSRLLLSGFLAESSILKRVHVMIDAMIEAEIQYEIECFKRARAEVNA